MSKSQRGPDELLRDGAGLEVDAAGPRRLRLRGELDVAEVPGLRSRLDAMGDDIELDCAELTFIDASGLQLFLAARRDCQERGAALTIVDPAPCVVRLLALTGLDSVLDARREHRAS